MGTNENKGINTVFIILILVVVVGLIFWVFDNRDSTTNTDALDRYIEKAEPSKSVN